LEFLAIPSNDDVQLHAILIAVEYGWLQRSSRRAIQVRNSNWNFLTGGALAALLAMTCACSDMDDQQQRAVSGGAIGAGGGALFGFLIGANPLLGAVVGGAGGAAVGALTSKDQANLNPSHSSSGGTANASQVQASAETSQLTKNVQSGLAKLGYDPGPADGIAGAKTRAAIREYQGYANLAVDGNVSPQLWQHIKSDLSQS
jgi:osmotically inducible lipoprotein OsmB